MKNNILMKISCVGLVAQLLLTPNTAFASPVIAVDSEQELIDASEIDDTDAVEDVNSKQKNHELANPEQVSEYLHENAQSNVIKQVPTDEHDTSLPAKFDLRDRGVVTPVKFQNPWGTCWGFAAIAACETSILSEMGKTYDETKLDLSEHHLTYFSRTYLRDGSTQDGEGIHMFNESESLNTGGFVFTASSLFSSGIGPVTEDLIPYRGKNSNTMHQLCINACYSPDDDWTLPDDYKFVRLFDLVESNILPSPAVYDFTDGLDPENSDDFEKAYVGYDASAVDTIKQELMEGRAVSICFCADTYLPSQQDTDGVSMYLNTNDNKWTHYTFESSPVNHAVTIVGWDDTIKSTDFLDHTNDKYGDGLAHQPEGDGAFIVKNSWGSIENSFPNLNDWGIKDESGKSTGYFYLSYYDRSLSTPETFRFDVSEDSDKNDAIMIDQYDFMPANGTSGWADKTGLQMANIFTAEADGKITSVAFQTNSENISTTAQIYLLDDNAVTPDDGKLITTATSDYAYPGYHKLSLDKPVLVNKGQRYSVVVTSCFSDGENVYYEFLTSAAENEASVNEHNRKVLYSHRGDPLPKDTTPEEAYADELSPLYFKGIVNEGESFVYVNSLGQWADFSQIVPYLQTYDEYKSDDFDNFPIKAYLEFIDASEATASIENTMSSGLEFSNPAKLIYFPFFPEALNIYFIVRGILAIVILLIVIAIKKAKKNKKILAHAVQLEKENNELKLQLSANAENDNLEPVENEITEDVVSND